MANWRTPIASTRITPGEIPGKWDLSDPADRGSSHHPERGTDTPATTLARDGADRAPRPRAAAPRAAPAPPGRDAGLRHGGVPPLQRAERPVRDGSERDAGVRDEHVRQVRRGPPG